MGCLKPAAVYRLDPGLEASLSVEAIHEVPDAPLDRALRERGLPRDRSVGNTGRHEAQNLGVPAVQLAITIWSRSRE